MLFARDARPPTALSPTAALSCRATASSLLDQLVLGNCAGTRHLSHCGTVSACNRSGEPATSLAGLGPAQESHRLGDGLSWQRVPLDCSVQTPVNVGGLAELLFVGVRSMRPKASTMPRSVSVATMSPPPPGCSRRARRFEMATWRVGCVSSCCSSRGVGHLYVCLVTLHHRLLALLPNREVDSGPASGKVRAHVRTRRRRWRWLHRGRSRHSCMRLRNVRSGTARVLLHTGDVLGDVINVLCILLLL